MNDAGHLVAGDIAGRQYAAAVLDALGGALAALSSIGSAYILIGFTRRAARFAGRWTTGRPRRRLIAVAATIALVASLVLFWATHGQFSDW